MVKLIKADFDGHAMQFNGAGWFNATAAAKAFGKRPIDWLKTGESQDYIAALCQRLGSDPASLQDIVKGKNAGTWLHPKLAVVFARWLSVDFAVCGVVLFIISKMIDTLYALETSSGAMRVSITRTLGS
jgi:hypothetical protein